MVGYDKKELEIVGEYRMPGIYGAAESVTPRYNYPITPRENMIRMLEGQIPLWLPNQTLDNNAIQPLVMPDARARNFGGTDWFGIEWEYEPLSQAAMVKPGTRRLSDITKWQEKIIWPDLSAIDWKKDYEENYKDRIGQDRFSYFVIVNGLFERTADLMGFEDAFCALLEEPEELTAFYDRLVDWHIELIKIARDIYHADMILFHDDMGTQINTFFSPDIFEELFVPQYQKITKTTHELGMYICLHSCGCVGRLLPLFIRSGFDAWEGQDNANDKKALMDAHGKELAQCTMYEFPADMSDDDAVAYLHKRVDELGHTGRLACRLWDKKPDRAVNLAEELYRYSREKYLGLQV